MIDEVEIDLAAPHAVWYRRGRQASRGDVERDMPGMVQPGRARQTNLADNLGPQMQRRIGLAPCRGREFRPSGSRGVVHDSPPSAVIGISLYQKAGRDPARPLFANLQMRTCTDWGCARYFVFAGSFAKAASTSSLLMRAPGFPG